MITQTESELRRPRQLGDQINFTFHFLRQHSRTLAKSTLFIVGPSTLLSAVVFGSLLIGSFQSYGAGLLNSSFSTLIVGFVLGGISALLLQGVAFEYIRLYLERDGGPISVDDVWRALRADFGKLLSGTLAVGLVYGLMYFCMFAFILFPVIGGLLAILAMTIGMYLAITLTFVVPGMIFERLSVGAAFSRSFEIIRKRWWTTLGLIFALTFISMYIAMIFLLPMQIVRAMFGFFGTLGGGGTEILMVILFASFTVLSYLTYLLPILGIGLHFFNLVERIEHVGLLARIDSIGTDELSANQSTG